MKLYDINVKDIKNNDVSLADYKGKVLLIFNSASKCGFTKQYKGLQELYSKYQSSGLELLDFPSNQFLEAPGSSEELASFCQVNFGTTFKTFAKIDVNGKNASPLFTFLKENVAEEKDNEEMSKFKKVLSDLKQTFVGDDIKWNFTKFLVDREGNVMARFAPTVTPDEIDGYVAKLL